MTYLALKLFGQFHVTRSNRSVAFGNEKAQALLAYLVTEARMHQRNALTALLWPNYREDSARTNLRQALHQLRVNLGDSDKDKDSESEGDRAAASVDQPFILVTRQTLQFNTDSPYELDAHRFVALLQQCERHRHASLSECPDCLQRLHDATQLYHGPFLEGFSIAESIQFEEWRRLVQERYHLQVVGALAQLAGAYERLGQYEQVQAYAARWVALEPYHEEAHRSLMRALALMGKPAAASAQYQACRELLVNEVGVPPDAQTTALYEQIRSGQLRAAPTAASLNLNEPLHGLAPQREPQPQPQPQPLPPALTNFVGRVDELNTLSEWVIHPQHRLITLTGPGGVGKTRLAIELVRRLQGAFPQGVFFVNLAAIDPHHSPEAISIAIANAIAAAMGMDLQGSQPMQTLIRLLADQQMLLVLDNMEHLLAEVRDVVVSKNDGLGSTALLMEMLQASPKIKLVVTSRERLNVRGECVFGVGGMTYWPEMSLAEAAQSPAIELFRQTAQLVRPDWQLQQDNLPFLLQICGLVHGMPLGLEIAASWVEMFSLSDIAQAIQKDIDFLVVNWRDVPDRHRSMRAVFDWSWHLLSADEQMALCSCAVFHGGFTFEAFQAVIGSSRARPLIARLVGKSLVYQRDGHHDGQRLGLHELLRQFAEEQLRANPDQMRLVEQRHAEFYLRYVEDRETAIYTAQARTIAAELRDDIHNIQKAVQWAAVAEHNRLDRLKRPLHGLWRYYKLSGRLSELLPLYGTVIDRLALAPSSDLAHALQGQTWGLMANSLVELHHYDEAVVLAERAIEQCGRDEITLGLLFGKTALGQVVYMRGQYAEAQTQLNEVLTLAERARAKGQTNHWLADIEMATLLWLAGTYREANDMATARELLMRGIALSRRGQSLFGEIHCLTNLAWPSIRTGDFISGQKYYERALALSQELNYRWGIGVIQREYGDLLRRQGQFTQAVELIEAALPVLREIGNILHECLAYVNLAEAYVYLGKLELVEERFERYRQAIQLDISISYTQLYGLLPMTKFYRSVGQSTAALPIAQRALTNLGEYGSELNRAIVHLSYANVCSDLERWTEATSHYKQAIALVNAVSDQTITLEAWAGLGRVALRAGDVDAAREHFERVLSVQAAQPIADLIDDVAVQWMSYTFLKATDHPQAVLVLQAACDRLNRYAQSIANAEDRDAFLNQIVVHRQLLALVQQASKPDEDLSSVSSVISATAPTTALNEQIRDREVKAVDENTSDNTALNRSRLGEIGIPETGPVFGRQAEAAQLESWLTQDRCKCVAVLGMGGMGKTTLVASTVCTIASQFDVVIWISLLNAPPLESVLRTSVQRLSHHRILELPAPLDEQLAMLIHKLQQQRCLLVLDNLESILQSEQTGVFRTGYEGYGQLMQHLIEGTHQSSLLFTSREQPIVVTRLGTESSRKTLRLKGLPFADGLAMLTAQGIAAPEADTRDLVQRYSGNPLALKLVTETIQELFGGDIAAFLAADALIFDDIRSVLDQQFARLTTLERNILTLVAIAREPVLLTDLRADIVQPSSPRAFMEALRSLQRRSLLASGELKVELQNVILEYVTERLIEDACNSIETGQAHVLNGHAFLNVRAKEYVRQSQLQLIVKPIAKQLSQRLGVSHIEQRFKQMLATLREATPRAAGYAAGNIINLLLELKFDLAQYDFSNLSVWQADLRGVQEVPLNFADADLSHSAFTLAFDSVAVKWDPSNSQNSVFIAGRNDGALCLWQAIDGQLHDAFRNAGRVTSPIEFSKDARVIAYGSQDYVIRVCSARDGAELLVLRGHTAKIYALKFSPDGRLLASASQDDTIRIWDVQTGCTVHVFREYANGVPGLAFNSTGTILAGGGIHQTICLWDTVDGQILRVLQSQMREVECCAFSPDDKLLVSGLHSGQIFVWELSSGQCLHTLNGHTNIVRALTFDPNGQMLASGSTDRSVCLWDTHDWQIRHTLLGQSQEIISLSFSMDGSKLVSASIKNTVQFWDTQTGHLLDTLSGHSARIHSIRFSPDGQWLASSSSTGQIFIWDLRKQTAPVVRSLRANTEAVLALTFSPDGKCLASGGADHMVRIWDVASGKVLQTLQGHTGPIKAIAYGLNGRVIASGGIDQSIRLWQTARPNQPKVLRGHSGEVIALAFDRTGQHMVSASLDYNACLWDVKDVDSVSVGPKLAHGNPLYAVAFSPDGQTLLTNSWDYKVRLWETASGRYVKMVVDADGRPIVALGVALSPNGEWMATIDDSHCIEIRDVVTGVVLARLPGHTQRILAIDFSPTSLQLVSSSWDGTIRLWDVLTGKCNNILRTPGPYVGMNITGVTGITEAQKYALQTLGAVNALSTS